MVTQIKNIIIPGSANHPIALDIFFEQDGKAKPIVVYAHGFNGFKDWGSFDIIARQFAQTGSALVKFNFSHNGTSPQTPGVFTNLEAFGNNNYTIQLADLQAVINWITHPKNEYAQQMDTHAISLIGHSMGGGIATLYAATDSRIKKLITWAGISECKTPWGGWPAQKMQQWQQSGVQYYANSRTGQQMPLYYQLYEDYVQHAARLDIQKAISSLTIPILICHGTQDMAVPVEKAYQLKDWQPAATLFLVESDHVFDRKHPWTQDKLPQAMTDVVEASIRFLHQPGI
jgi:uncharacterized protein